METLPTPDQAIAELRKVAELLEESALDPTGEAARRLERVSTLIERLKQGRSIPGA